MVSIKTLYSYLERSGMINFHRFSLPWQDRLQTFYTCFQFSIFLIIVLSHFYSTLTRAVRYQPEFIQMLLEDAIDLFVLCNVCFWHIMIAELNNLVVRVEFCFTKAYPKINEVCAKRSRRLLTLFVSFVFAAICGSFIETMLPLAPSELAVRQEIYRTQHPERRLPYNLRFPFIDETESYAYEIIYAVSTYFIMFWIMWVSISVSLAPIILTDFHGQYKILSGFLAMLGRPHRDEHGHRIYYTSIEKNQYVIKMYGESASESSKKAQWRMERQYDRQFMRQIFVYHQKLLTFQEELMTIFSPLVFALLIANNVIISLCLYQIVASPTKLTPLRYFKFGVQLLAALIEYSMLCNCSDITAECHEMLRRAFEDSQWRSCTRETRKDLIMLLRRTTRENHMRFFNSAVILNRAYILKVLKVGYSFVNYMKLRQEVRSARMSK